MSRIDDLIAEYCPDGVEYKRLGDVCKIKNGKDYKHLSAGDIPVYGSGGVMDVRVDTSVYNRPTVLLPRKGSIANVFYVDGPFWNVDTIFYTVIDEEQVIPRYLYHS
jgi:type I restriction enzyme S subunit